MLVKLIGGPLDGAELTGDYKADRLHLPILRGVTAKWVEEHEPLESVPYQNVTYFRRSQGVYVWEGMKQGNKEQSVG